jgi:hypothetical protein
MSPDTAEMTIAQSPPASASRASGRQWLSTLTADASRIVALRDTWRALWVSRLLVWVAGVGTVATLGFGPTRGAFDPPGVTRGFGWLGNLLAAPAARWDSAWYLVIAHYGYRPELSAYGTSARDAFFPLYPLGLRALSDLGLAPVLAGVLFSLVAFAAALYGIHRLCTLELDGARAESDSHSQPGSGTSPGLRHDSDTRSWFGSGSWPGAGPRRTLDVAPGTVARLAVLVMALTPMAFYFSAVYSESLYLALSVGLFWCARQGRWAWVGMLGALATATRSTGVVLLVPALILYLYGPREDRIAEVALGERRGSRGLGGSGWRGELGRRNEPDRRGHGERGLLGRLRPRYRLRANVLWLALVPAGMGVYMAYLGLHGGDPLAPLFSQNGWGRHFAGPFVGVWDGARAALEGVRQLLATHGAHAHVYYPAATGSPTIAAGHNLMLFAFLLAAIPLLAIVLRALPLAYGAYVLAALVLPLSFPAPSQPLMSLSRFLLVLFPLGMALAVWLAAHPRMRLPALVASAVLMMFFTAQFATWHWVA